MPSTSLNDGELGVIMNKLEKLNAQVAVARCCRERTIHYDQMSIRVVYA